MGIHFSERRYLPVEEFRFREGEAPAEPYFSVFVAQRELRPPFFNGLLCLNVQDLAGLYGRK
jgi:hypothetical protein